VNLFDINGKKAVVTGGAGGLGFGMADALVQNGAETVIIDIHPDLSDRVANLCRIGTAYGITGDISSSAGRRSAFNAAMEKLGQRVDIFINCAGIQRRSSAMDFSMEDWQKVLDINLTAVFEFCQLAARNMLSNGGGKIINVASMLSFFGGLNVPAYTASKGGVAQLTKALANEWAAKNIHVNAIAPGYMATEMNSALLQNAERNRKILDRIPAGRWGTAEDIQGVILFLASKASDYIHGAVIPVDGGYLGC